MSDQGFPLPGSSYKELVKIIQGYDQVGKEAVPSDVAKIIAVHETIVSINNRFLVAAGIVQGGRKKTITSAGSELALALQHGMESEVGTKWRAIVDTTDFLQKIVAAVRIRKGMDESSLQSHVAYSAGQPKTPRVLTGAATIVEILRVAALLKEDAGNLVAATPEIVKEVEQPIVSPIVSSMGMPPTSPAAWDVSRQQPSRVQLNIEVRVQCTPGDLEGLGEKLRKVISDVNQPEPPKNPSPTANAKKTEDAD